MKSFTIPPAYRSEFITEIKEQRKKQDGLKKDFSPTLLDLGTLQILLARHFGPCYGVENAIETAYRALEDNPGRRIFLLSEMIHNPHVNNDLTRRGIRFIMDTKGNQLIPWESLSSADIVIIPAFGTTLSTIAKLSSLEIDPLVYDATCPFVERVWKKADQIGKLGYTVIIHGAPDHEETRATFSHSVPGSPTLIIRNMGEAKLLTDFINNEKSAEEFFEYFRGRYSTGFDPMIHLEKIGVVNQTTMLATETKAIAEYLRETMIKKYQLTEAAAATRFADTSDTLCYATNDNQRSVLTMLKEEADLAIIVGGYNSSNTTHLAELCESVVPTYFISSDEKMISPAEIRHWDFHRREEMTTLSFLPAKDKVRVLLTSGASCPDVQVEKVIRKLVSFCYTDENILL